MSSLDPDRRVSSLAVGERQLVEFAAAVGRPCALLVLDEPTAALTPAEAEGLLNEVEARRREGMGVLLVTHRLEEVERRADRVTVLRDGRFVACRAARETARDEWVGLMVGRPPAAAPAPAGDVGGVALRGEALRGAGFADVTFEVRRGEIVGLAGLRGAGRTALLRAACGADALASGRIFLRGSSRAVALPTPAVAADQGLAFVPEERQSEGLLLPLSGRANLSLTRLRAARSGVRTVSRKLEEGLARPLADAFGVRARSLEQPVAELSGGNQQKVLLARALARDAEVILLDEPTRGIDVGARGEVHARLRALAAEGKAILVASSDLEELVALADRILVMAEGRLRGEFRRPFSPEAILTAAIPGAREKTA
jgi:ribose transport system ATP-binding protein